VSVHLPKEHDRYILWAAVRTESRGRGVIHPVDMVAVALATEPVVAMGGGEGVTENQKRVQSEEGMFASFLTYVSSRENSSSRDAAWALICSFSLAAIFLNNRSLRVRRVLRLR
jgi:hypothetical protein